MADAHASPENTHKCLGFGGACTNTEQTQRFAAGCSDGGPRSRGADVARGGSVIGRRRPASPQRTTEHNQRPRRHHLAPSQGARPGERPQARALPSGRARVGQNPASAPRREPSHDHAPQGTRWARVGETGAERAPKWSARQPGPALPADNHTLTQIPAERHARRERPRAPRPRRGATSAARRGKGRSRAPPSLRAAALRSCRPARAAGAFSRAPRRASPFPWQ